MKYSKTDLKKIYFTNHFVAQNIILFLIRPFITIIKPNDTHFKESINIQL